MKFKIILIVLITWCIIELRMLHLRLNQQETMMRDSLTVLYKINPQKHEMRKLIWD